MAESTPSPASLPTRSATPACGYLSGFAPRKKETGLEAGIYAQSEIGCTRPVRCHRYPGRGGDPGLSIRKEAIAGDHRCRFEKISVEVESIPVYWSLAFPGSN